MKKVAIIGTVGVPANYGGFETLVENLIAYNRLDDLQYAVYCSKQNYNEKRWVYRGAKTIYLPFKANGIQSIIYDVISILHAVFKADVLLVLGVSGCVILPFVRLFCKKRIIINIDGLEHRRDKWKPYVKKFLKFSESLAVRYADCIVTDNRGIQTYVTNEYKKPSELIEYGGDHVLCGITGSAQAVLGMFGLAEKKYSLALCRIEPENNVRMILEAYRASGEQLVFIGNWENSAFGKDLKITYRKYPNLILLPPIYDIEQLNLLRANCKFYVHGHSAGGTNPSLVEAMYFNRPVFAFDVVYNRETTENKAHYFTDVEQLAYLSRSDESLYAENENAMGEIARRRYSWKRIAKQYELLFGNL